MLNEASICPNCGTKALESLKQDALSKFNKLALLFGCGAFMFTIISFFIFGFLSFIGLALSILGLYYGHLGEKYGQDVYSVRLLNIFGMVLASISVFINLLYYISLIMDKT